MGWRSLQVDEHSQSKAKPHWPTKENWFLNLAWVSELFTYQYETYNYENSLYYLAGIDLKKLLLTIYYNYNCNVTIIAGRVLEYIHLSIVRD